MQLGNRVFLYGTTLVGLQGGLSTFTRLNEGVMPVLNVSDAAGLHGLDMMNVTVSGEPIPEFGSVLVPTMLLLIVAVGLWRRTSKDS